MVYFDANGFSYGVERIDPNADPLTPMWDQAQAGQGMIVSSELVILEKLANPPREDDGAIESPFRELFEGSDSRLRAEARLSVPDAIHAPTARQAGCALFVTNDADRLRFGAESAPGEAQPERFLETFRPADWCSSTASIRADSQGPRARPDSTRRSIACPTLDAGWARPTRGPSCGPPRVKSSATWTSQLDRCVARDLADRGCLRRPGDFRCSDLVSRIVGERARGQSDHFRPPP